MPSILEVIIACKEQGPATEEDLRLTVVALSTMLHLVEDEERQLVEAVLADKSVAKIRARFAQQASERRFKSRKMTPREYLGENYTPGTEANRRLREQSTRIFEAATGERL